LDVVVSVLTNEWVGGMRKKEKKVLRAMEQGVKGA